MQTAILGFGLRVLEGLAAAAPTLLVGVLVAGCLRNAVPPQWIHRLWTGRGWRSLARPLLLAPVIPVCSLGVLPIMRELRRVGVPPSSIVTYAVAAALLNPIALVYGLTGLPWLHFAVLIGLALLAALAAGGLALTCDGTAPSRPIRNASNNDEGMRRIANGIIAAGRIATGPLLADVALALSVSAFAASLIPPDYLPDQMMPSTWKAPLWMLAAASPAYVCPATGTMQMIVLVRAQLSFAAVAIVLLLGIGQNAAFARHLAQTLGPWRTIVFAAGMAVCCIAVGFSVDATCNRPDEIDADIHAIDSLARPHSASPAAICTKLREPSNVAAIPFLAFIAVGVACRREGIDRIRKNHLTKRHDGAIRFWQRPLPRPLAAFAAAAVGGAILTAMLYTYYPPIDQLFADMQVVRTNAVLALQHGQKNIAIRELDDWDHLAAKLPFSTAMRFSHPAPQASEKLRTLRILLQKAREAASSPSAEERKTLSQEVNDQYHLCREAFLAPTTP